MGAGWTLGNITANPWNLLSLTTAVKNNQAQCNVLLNLKNSNEIGNIGEEKTFHSTFLGPVSGTLQIYLAKDKLPGEKGLIHTHMGVS